MSDRIDWEQFAERALAGEALTREEARQVLRAPDEELLSLLAASARVRRAHFGNRVKLNFLVNVKSGLCPEDCHYCSQSSVSKAPIAKYPNLSPDEILAAADRAVASKAARFCMVASGRGPTEREVAHLAETIKAVKARHPDLELCACLGLLKEGQAEQLSAAGVHAYNHNLNTSEQFYDEICSTHTFKDRAETVKRAREAGLSPCSGGLFGMGETEDDILELAYSVREMDVDSIPLNFLIPIPGTPLAEERALTPTACLKILCLFRLLNPSKEIRIAGGREVQLRWLQPFGLHVANSVFIGDYLTTKGQPPASDLAMIRDLGFTIEGFELPDEGELPWGQAIDLSAVGQITKTPNC
jgi:biotin synthase